MKMKWILALVLAALFMAVLATAVVAAQEEPPAPYAGMKNPFAWTDSAAQTAGGNVYKQSCQGCHGVRGDGLPAFNFAKTEYGQNVETRPDYYFWILSEGRLSNGMPPFKSSLSDEKRWQVLTYIRTLGSGTASSGSASAAPAVKGLLQLAAPEQVQTGEKVVLKATFQDDSANPIADIPVKFYLEEQFFTTALMEIGEAITDAQGVAVLEYAPHRDGILAAVVRSGESEARANVSVIQGAESAYEPEAGLHFPAPGPRDIIFPKSTLTLQGLDRAPLPAFRLPGGILSWLLIVVAIVFMIWFTYWRVMYQVFRIPIKSDIRDINTRLIPAFGMAMVIFISVVLILKLLISPYSHLHIPPF